MSFLTLILGFLAGLITGMILAAGGWRQALGKVGSYATRLAETPPAPAASPAPKALPDGSGMPVPPSGS